MVRRSVRRANGGFTLLELMIAIGVMLVGIAAAFGGQVRTQDLMRQSRETQLALTQIETVAESIIAQVPSDLPASDEWGHGQVVDLPTQVPLRNLQVVCTYPEYDPLAEVPNPLEVRIEASWTDFEGRQRSVHVATAVSQ